MLTVPWVFLHIPLAMVDLRTASTVTDLRTESPVTRIITMASITIQRTAAVVTQNTTKTIPLIGLETLTPTRVADISGTRAANWNWGAFSRAVTCSQQGHVIWIPALGYRE